MVSEKPPTHREKRSSNGIFDNSLDDLPEKADERLGFICILNEW